MASVPSRDIRADTLFPEDWTNARSDRYEDRRPSLRPVALGRAIEAGDVDHQLARYADDAQVQVREVDPDNNSPGPLLQLLGLSAIQAWIHAVGSKHTKPPIVTLVVAEDHLAFTERWRHRDGLNMLSTSSAELSDGLITFQHTNVSWDRRPQPVSFRPCFSGQDPMWPNCARRAAASTTSKLDSSPERPTGGAEHGPPKVLGRFSRRDECDQSVAAAGKRRGGGPLSESRPHTPPDDVQPRHRIPGLPVLLSLAVLRCRHEFILSWNECLLETRRASVSSC